SHDFRLAAGGVAGVFLRGEQGVLMSNVIEVMSDEDNRCVRRALRNTAPLRLMHKGSFTADQFRIAGAVERDLIRTQGSASGGSWVRLPSGGYVALPRATDRRAAPQ